jgi:tetratricopeptide (TPR) repeat protein
MTLNDNTKRIIFIALAIIFLSSIILPLVATRFEEQKTTLSTGTIKSLWWAGKIIFFISMPLMVFWVALFFYADRLRSRMDTTELAARMKIVASIIPWLTIVLLVLSEAKFVIILYRGSDHLVFTSIEFLLLGLCLGYSLFYSWPLAQYCRKQPLCNIVAACFLEQHEKFVKARDLDKAYSTLLKACEMNLDGVWLWCRLAIFCEHTRKNSTEADNYMAKAEELITTTKANNAGDKACYLGYLGLINYVRGERDKGLEYIKQAINIDSKPYLIKLYEDLLSNSKNTQPDTNLPDPKTVT